MSVSALINVIRTDYLYDTVEPYMWDDASLLRKLSEAQRQACNRSNLIYDDSTAQYAEITLSNGQASYAIDPKITVIENIFFAGKSVEKKTKDGMDAISSTWRTDSSMAGKTVYCVVSGRSLRVSPMPDASDAGEVVTLEVYRLPATEIASTGDSLEIPAEHHHDLIYWVLHECYKKRTDDGGIFDQEKSDYNLARFNQVFGQPVSAAVRQHQFESPRSLVISPFGYVSAHNADDSEDWQ